jgi:hypothetical protein
MMVMKGWSVDKIVAVGLVGMGVLSIIGYIAHIIMTGNSNGTEIPMAIVSGLTGYIGRGAVQSMAHEGQSQTAQTLGQVSEVASQGQQIVNAIDTIKDVIKPKK